MANECEGCQYYQKETLEVPTNTGSINQDTWISKADPNDPEAQAVEFARCSNENTTNEIIARDSNGQWFFDTDFLMLVTPIVVTCQKSTCVNYSAI